MRASKLAFQLQKKPMMEDRERERLLIPALAPLYQCLDELAWPLIRITWGTLLVLAGWHKLTGPLFERDLALFHSMGMEPALPLMWFITLLEFVGGFLLAIGLLTRPIAAAVFIEMMVIVFAVPHQRFDTLALLWGLMALAMAFRGGGPYSLDRLIGKEI
jgi:putative oxidoreductase